MSQHESGIGCFQQSIGIIVPIVVIDFLSMLFLLTVFRTLNGFFATRVSESISSTVDSTQSKDPKSSGTNSDKESEEESTSNNVDNSDKSGINSDEESSVEDSSDSELIEAVRFEDNKRKTKPSLSEIRDQLASQHHESPVVARFHGDPANVENELGKDHVDLESMADQLSKFATQLASNLESKEKKTENAQLMALLRSFPGYIRDIVDKEEEEKFSRTEPRDSLSDSETAERKTESEILMLALSNLCKR
jgi:hypothetical protein